MYRNVWITGIITASCLICADAAMAARGIVVGKPNTGTGAAGKMLVTAGSSDAPDNLAPGDAIKFTEDAKANLGDLVDFAVSPDPAGELLASGLTVVVAGKVVSSNVIGTVTVGAREVVLVLGGAVITGKVSVNGGTLAIVDNSSVEGKIENAGGDVFVVGPGARISDGIAASGPGSLVVSDATIGSKLSSSGNSFVAVRNCTIKGKLEILTAGICKSSGNTVEGKTNTPGCK